MEGTSVFGEVCPNCNGSGELLTAPIGVDSSEFVVRHTWNIHYANAKGESFHHKTIFEDEVRQIAAKALESGMISLTVLRTLNPVPHNKLL